MHQSPFGITNVGDSSGVSLYVYVCRYFFDRCTYVPSRHKDIRPQAKSGVLKGSYDDDPELTAQLHQTLADFEANLAGERHTMGVSPLNLKLDLYFFI